MQVAEQRESVDEVESEIIGSAWHHQQAMQQSAPLGSLSSELPMLKKSRVHAIYNGLMHNRALGVAPVLSVAPANRDCLLSRQQLLQDVGCLAVHMQYWRYLNQEVCIYILHVAMGATF